LWFGTLGLVSIRFIEDPRLLLVSMVCVGIAWASILSLPYAMLS
jgi:maltose/moltooligosaccharide transporter